LVQPQGAGTQVEAEVAVLMPIPYIALNYTQHKIIEFIPYFHFFQDHKPIKCASIHHLFDAQKATIPNIGTVNQKQMKCIYESAEQNHGI
jgi:hypothetical protein